MRAPVGPRDLSVSMNVHALKPLAVRAALLLTWPLILTAAFGIPLPIGVRAAEYLWPDFYSGGIAAEGAARLAALVAGTSLTILSARSRWRFLLAPGIVLVVLHAILLLESIERGAGWMLDVFTIVSAIPFAGSVAWSVVACVDEARLHDEAATSGRASENLIASSTGSDGRAERRTPMARSLLVAEVLLCIQLPTTVFLCLSAPSLNFGADGWETAGVVLLVLIGCSAAVGLVGLKWASRRGLPRELRIAQLILLVCLGAALMVGLGTFVFWSLRG